MPPVKDVDVGFTIDTTGSMFACLAQVKRRVAEMMTKLFAGIPGLRVGIIAHGDYCDERTYVTQRLDLTSDRRAIEKFINSLTATGGGDAPECYELALHKARDFAWGSGTKALVVIGDNVPHPTNYPQNTLKLDWRVETEHLLKMDVKINAVQALNRPHATPFYKEMARITGGFHLTLDQFSDVVELVMAICLGQNDPDQLQEFANELAREGRINRNLDEALHVLLRYTIPSRRFATRDLEAVEPGRFQVLDVDTDTPIKEFVLANGLTFKKGRGFYKLMKVETVQDYKETILREDETGDFYTGEKARELLGLPRSGSVKGRFKVPTGYTAFVQSTSVNRKLIAGTEFLYEVDRDR